MPKIHNDRSRVFLRTFNGRRICTSLALALILAGCANQQQNIQPIDIKAINAVQAEIKHQIGVYMAASQPPIMIKVNDKYVDVSKEQFWCGNGAIGFDVASVKAELTTSLANTGDFKAGLTLPISPVTTLGPSAEVKPGVTNTETLDYNLWPVETASQSPAVLTPRPSEEELRKAPIALALRDLRDALILSAMKTDYSKPQPALRSAQPCFRDYPPDKPGGDAGDTFKLGLSITNDASGGISIKTTFLTLSASGESVSTTGNTLTVSFVQSGVQEIQYLKDAVDTECKYPNQLPQPTQKCTDAKNALANAEKNLGNGFR